MAEIRGTQSLPSSLFEVNRMQPFGLRIPVVLFIVCCALFVGLWIQWPFFSFVQFPHPDLSHRGVSPSATISIGSYFRCLVFSALLWQGSTETDQLKRERDIEIERVCVWGSLITVDQAKRKKKGYPKVPCFDTDRPLSVLFWGFVGCLLARNHITDPFRVKNQKIFIFAPFSSSSIGLLEGILFIMDRSQAGRGAAYVSSMQGESGTLLSIQSRTPLLFHHSCISAQMIAIIFICCLTFLFWFKLAARN